MCFKFLGGAWFQLFGAVPAARSLRPSCCLKVTKSVFSRCGPMDTMPLVAILGGAGVYLLSRQTKSVESGWLVPTCVFTAMQLYKVKLLLPINHSIINDELPEDEAHKTVDNWLSYDLWHTLAGTGTFFFLSYLLATK